MDVRQVAGYVWTNEEFFIRLIYKLIDGGE